MGRIRIPAPTLNLCPCPSVRSTIEWADYPTDGWNVELRQFIRSKSQQQKLKLSGNKMCTDSSIEPKMVFIAKRF